MILDTATEPTLAISVKGEVISSNVSEFREFIRIAISSINRQPTTDEEFGQAELDVKKLKTAEDVVKSAKEKALTDAEHLHALFSELDSTSEEIRLARLELEKVVNTKKEEVKASIVADGIAQLECAERHRQPVYGRSVAEALKGKRTLDSMRKAVAVVVTTHNGTIKKARALIDSFVSAHGAELVMDREELETKSPDSVEGELRRRFEGKKAAAEKAELLAAAEKAKAEVADLKHAASEVGKPPAPPAPPAPPSAGNQAAGQTAAEEWVEFGAGVVAAFSPLKNARAGLKHPANQAKAATFATAVGAAWGEANK